jgi:hypothetical protein
LLALEQARQTLQKPVTNTSLVKGPLAAKEFDGLELLRVIAEFDSGFSVCALDAIRGPNLFHFIREIPSDD